MKERLLVAYRLLVVWIVRVLGWRPIRVGREGDVLLGAPKLLVEILCDAGCYARQTHERLFNRAAQDFDSFESRERSALIDRRWFFHAQILGHGRRPLIFVGGRRP